MEDIDGTGKNGNVFRVSAVTLGFRRLAADGRIEAVLAISRGPISSRVGHSRCKLNPYFYVFVCRSLVKISSI
jgi:hypothetical protein